MSGSPLEILKGTLEVLVLTSLRGGPNHGYGIARWLKETSSEAFQVEEGALYPALRRMETRGLLLSDWDVTETGREAKFYRLSTEGERKLQAAREEWARYVTAMDQVLEGGTEG
jgi:transcriptional regulator